MVTATHQMAVMPNASIIAMAAEIPILSAMHPITYLVDGTVLPPCYVCSIFLLSSVFQHIMCEKSFLSYLGVTSVKKCKFMGYKTCANKN